MTFGHPLLLLSLLVPVAAAAAYVWAERRPARYPVAFTNLEVLAAVAAGARPWRRWVAPSLLLVALAALCVGLARPHATTTVTDERATVILVLDASRSMQSTDVKPNRLEAAEQAARIFLERAPKRLRVALIVFSGDVQVAVPPTIDHDLVRAGIDGIGGFSGFGGTAIGDAIARAVEVGEAAVGANQQLAAAVTPTPSARGLVSIIFLSDGRQNRGILQPLDGAARAKAAGIPVNTIALGTSGGGGGGGGFFPAPPGGGGPFGGFNRAPDPATLRAIARLTGGLFFHARTAGSVKSAYEQLGSSLGRKRGHTEVTYAFLLAAAVLLVGSAAAGARWSPRIP